MIHRTIYANTMDVHDYVLTPRRSTDDIFIRGQSGSFPLEPSRYGDSLVLCRRSSLNSDVLKMRTVGGFLLKRIGTKKSKPSLKLMKELTKCKQIGALCAKASM